MSTTSSSLPADSLPPPPPGTNYIAAMKPSLNLLMIGTTWSSMLIPITIALFFFSTPTTRRQPVFILNVISISLGLVQGILNFLNETGAILGKPIQTNINIAYVTVEVVIPLFSGSILVVRVFAAYHPSRLSAPSRALVYGPIVLFKLARLTNGVMYAAKWILVTRADSRNILQAGQISWSWPYAKIEWLLMLFDTSYASLLFLLRLREGTMARKKGIVNSASTQSASFRSYASRLKALFWISISNFVFPVLLGVIQLILIFRDDNFLDGSYVFITNTYVQIIGVLLATVWNTGSRWYDSEETRHDVALDTSTLHFAPVVDDQSRPSGVGLFAEQAAQDDRSFGGGSLAFQIYQKKD